MQTDQDNLKIQWFFAASGSPWLQERMHLDEGEGIMHNGTTAARHSLDVTFSVVSSLIHQPHLRL